MKNFDIHSSDNYPEYDPNLNIMELDIEGKAFSNYNPHIKYKGPDIRLDYPIATLRGDYWLARCGCWISQCTKYHKLSVLANDIENKEAILNFFKFININDRE